MKNTFHRIIDVAERADHLADDISILLRNPTDEPMHSEVLAALHRMQVAARDLAHNAAHAVSSLSETARKHIAHN
jgi:hypothetical protein